MPIEAGEAGGERKGDRCDDLKALASRFDSSLAETQSVMRELLKIRNRSGRIVALEPNQAQRQFERDREARNIVLKARQMGITTWIAGRFFVKTITHPGTVTVQVAHTQEAAEAIFRIVHRFLNLLPESLREGPLKGAKVSARRIAFPGLDSEYLVETAGDRNAGRGLTISNLHCTELARWPGDPEETLAGLRATLSPDGELVMESTPDGASGCFWKEWQEAQMTGTRQHFFPWWLEEAYKAAAVDPSSLSEEERKLRLDHDLSLEQIGYRRQLQGNFRGLARQEYAEDAESCFLASGSCWFEVEPIDRRLLTVPQPIAKRGDLWIWARAQPGREYVVAVDPAGGSPDGDYTAVQVIDREQGLQCAELRTRCSLAETAEEAAKLAREYNGALLAVERNNQGTAVLAYLHTVSHYENLYCEARGEEGWLTTGSNRTRTLAEMGAALGQTPQLFSSERLLRECRTFVRQEAGQPSAAAGEHDDCVMAMAIALAVREKCFSGRRAVA